jgi:hypothetical protein
MKTILCFLVVLFVSNGTWASEFINVTPSARVYGGTLTLEGANGPVVVKFDGDTYVDAVLFSKDSRDLKNQSPTDIMSAMEQEFYVSGLVSIGAGNLSGNAVVFTSNEANPFNYLAIHFGKHELFIKFLTPTVKFSITIEGKAAGLSNYRVFYLNETTFVPVEF